ncbi:MAG: phosphoribosylformylglycinamidine cyclo-ligase [Bacillota bacterium]
MDYKSTGVDREQGDLLASVFHDYINSTKESPDDNQNSEFAGLYELPSSGTGSDNYLVAGADGVGTKLEIAIKLDKHDTIGQDLVAMSVNDILTRGARPLFFLDYIATAKLVPEREKAIVSGIAAACQNNGLTLLGGETAEMPGVYPRDKYDLAGFAVGLVQKEDILPKRDISAGDILIGLSSSGLHSNGFTLARHVLLSQAGYRLTDSPLTQRTNLGEEMLKPTLIYTEPIMELQEARLIKAMAHITGGGIPGNLDRVLPDGLEAELTPGSWNVQEIFQLIKKSGDISSDEMARTFNLGIGAVLIIKQEAYHQVIEICEKFKTEAVKIGHLTSDKGNLGRAEEWMLW